MSDPTLPDSESDPFAPTKIDGAAAFREAAEENPGPAAAAKSTGDHPLWVPPEPEELDALLPAFHVEKLLGREGMGAVYRAKQISLNRKVAIKVLPPEFGRDEAFAQRFKREAHALAELKHTNIVDIYDFGQTEGDDGGYYYFVMEFVDGMDFHQLIHGKKLDIPGALNAVSQICDALSYAHSKGYIHRDIKPANIFLNYEGQVKVGDFGLAKLIDPQSSEADTAAVAVGAEPSLTITGTAMGTPFYSAPEQLRGMSEVDQRADIYSLGVMFYEMLTGSIPQGAFDPPSKKVAIDVRVDDVVLKAMAEEPERRYETAVELRTDVDAIRTAPDVDLAAEDEAEANSRRESASDGEQRKDATPTSKKALWIAVASIAVVAAAAAVSVFVLNPSKPEMQRMAEQGSEGGADNEQKYDTDA
ncbi:MAG: serine/threonine-protein kinase [Verrucomicrobiota bacterium]